MIRLGDLAVRTKLGITFGALLLGGIAAAGVSTWMVRASLREAAEVELTNVVNHLYRLCQIRYETHVPGAAQGPTAQDLAFLGRVIRPMRVGTTGYPYCLDGAGTLAVHPSQEGENILASRDSSGTPFIAQMITAARRLGPGAVGTIRYPWRSPEIETREALPKILKYRYFAPWDWVIAAGSYEHEIYQAAQRITGLLVPLIAAGLIFAVLLTLGVARAITAPLADLTRAARKLEQGDLDATPGLPERGDEFGVLARSFASMAAEIRDKTRDMERRIERRTAALVESRERYRSLVQSTVDGILTTDLQGRVEFVNRGFEEMLGYRAAELLGRPVWKLYGGGRREAAAIMKRLRRDGRITNLEMELIGKQHRVPIRGSAALLRGADGNPRGTLGVCSDRTAEKALQAELRATQARVVQSTKLRALGDLVAGVAHEVNNPLMASTTLLHLMDAETCPAGCPNRDRIQVLQRCNQRIASIVDHLREFSRQGELELSPLDVHIPLENALLITGQLLLNRQIEVRRALAANLPPVSGDSNALEQVFLDLIANARDAMAAVPGPRILTLGSGPTVLDGAPAVQVRVSDTGPGISGAIREKIFEPFFTTKQVGEGTGLGLAISYTTVAQHGGRLEVVSGAPGHTTVAVTLPAVTPDLQEERSSHG